MHDLPLELNTDTGVEDFKRDWLMANDVLRKAHTVRVFQGNVTGWKPYLYHINVIVSPDRTDVAAYLTFNDKDAAEACMRVIWQWWRARPDGTWGFIGVKWMTGKGF